MNQMDKQIPIKFIAINLLVIGGIFVALYFTEPIQSMWGGYIALLIIAAFIVAEPASSRLTKKLPLPIQAISYGINKYISYLYVAFLGWSAHKLFVTSEDKIDTLQMFFIVIIVSFTITIYKNYRKFFENHKAINELK